MQNVFVLNTLIQSGDNVTIGKFEVPYFYFFYFERYQEIMKKKDKNKTNYYIIY